MTTERLEKDAVIVECTLDEAPKKVWRAMTEPALLAAWLMDNDISAQQGARFTFAPDDRTAPEGRISCEVLAVEPERLLRLAWRGADDRRDAEGNRLDSVVSFELRPTDEGGTWLRVVHSGFAVRAQAAGNVVPLRRRTALPPTALRMAA